MTHRCRIAVVGFGRIARTEHLPAIGASGDFELAAVVDPVNALAGVPCFTTLESLLDSALPIDAVALCQPPQDRYRAARLALRAGLDVLLEKPPGATVTEVESLLVQARASGRTLFAAWHSRFAPTLSHASAWLAGRTIRSVSVAWREYVEDWHPGQQWVWSPGGFGVFDAGINALSIVTLLLEAPLHVVGGTLRLPRNQATPIAADLKLETPDGVAVEAYFDWNKPGPAEWVIDIATDRGDLKLTEGGGRLWCGGVECAVGPSREYAGLYSRFAELIRTRDCEVDLAPLRTAADALLRCRRIVVEPYDARVIQ